MEQSGAEELAAAVIEVARIQDTTLLYFLRFRMFDPVGAAALFHAVILGTDEQAGSEDCLNRVGTLVCNVDFIVPKGDLFSV